MMLTEPGNGVTVTVPRLHPGGTVGHCDRVTCVGLSEQRGLPPAAYRDGSAGVSDPGSDRILTTGVTVTVPVVASGHGCPVTAEPAAGQSPGTLPLTAAESLGPDPAGGRAGPHYGDRVECPHPPTSHRPHSHDRGGRWERRCG
eukprot:751162-Hanusia_phi.AAC.2